MVVRRAATRYRKIQDEQWEHQDDIGLSQQHWQDSHDAFELDNIEDDSQREVTLGLQNTTTSVYSYDNNPLHATSAVQPRLQRPVKERFLAGWRVGALLSLSFTTLVCILNLAITIWVWKQPGHEIDGSIGTLFEGNCGRARKTNVWIHLVVNLLSTLLLCASNYCMQVLSAPSREELVRAHAKRHWLHIGVPGLRNLFRIGVDRAILWIILFLSSVPLHLLFNSVVFTNLQANRYTVIPTTENWINGGLYDNSSFMDVAAHDMRRIMSEIDKSRPNLTDEAWLGPKGGIPRYLKVSTADCFNKYSSQYLTDAGNVYLIQDGPTVWRDLDEWYPAFNSSGQFVWTYLNSDHSDTAPFVLHAIKANNAFPFQSQPEFYPSNGWRCPSRTIKTCDVDNEAEVPQDRSKWEPYERRIKYCLIEQVKESCKLQFSFSIAVTVVVSNFIKAVCMTLTLLLYRRHAALVTIGDAVASFLDNPDPETRGRCLHSRRLIEAEWNWEDINGPTKDGLSVDPEKFEPKAETWARAPSGGKWLATYILYLAAIIFGIVCMARSLSGMPKDPVKLWQIGFGTLRGNNLLNIGTSLIGGILVANLPQAVLSYLYLAFNALYTNMFVAKEWSNYIRERKPLRVTSPVGQQRGTYWLNVPFRYAIPMTIVSGLFHWLVSQSIFMVQISVTEWRRSNPERTIEGQISTCGFSPVAIILATVLGTVIAGGGLVIGKLRYPAGMPIASSCSAAISAACHRAPDDVNASLLPVQWGAITYKQRGSSVKEQIGHCSFSSLPVEPPIPGQMYA